MQGAGKTTFYAERFLHTHVRISQDLLRTRHRVRRFLAVCLETRQPFVVDRVNATVDERAVFVRPALAAGYTVVAYWFDVPAEDALARNAARDEAARVPVKALLGTHKRLVPPSAAEGFAAVHRVQVVPGGGFVVDAA